MIFRPESYALADLPHHPFVDEKEIKYFLERAGSPTLAEVRAVVDKSLARQRLSLQDTALLVRAEDPRAVALILGAARELKKQIYGNRIVLFAPLYIGNRCVNHCTYCGFRADNRQAVRHTLSEEELVRETENLERAGHKRLILVYGEHPRYDAGFIARTVRTVYGVKTGSGEIRRVNINAAPLDTEGFRIVKEAGIGTYQVFQETYHRASYARYHPAGRKADYDFRLTAFDRAMEAGIDDVGIGVLLGLYDWRFELLALVRHANHLEACYGVGPHTISFPRIKKASGARIDPQHFVGDEDFIRMVAILRLAVPYTGLILTAREPAALRDRLLEYGVSQIDAGTRLEIGGYSSGEAGQNLNREQFELHDERTLAQTLGSLASGGYLPSFCTACYRKGRTGEHFMEFSVNGFIKRYCTPNAILTFAEYLEDYAEGTDRERGRALIERELEAIRREDPALFSQLADRLRRVRAGERDLLF